MNGLREANGKDQENNLLKKILTIDDTENSDASLVDMYRDLMFIAERLKTGIQDAVDKDAREAANKKKKFDDNEEEENSEEDDVGA